MVWQKLQPVWLDMLANAVDLNTRAVVNVHILALRGCEHRSGMLLSDVLVVAETHVDVLIAERTSERKLKTRPGRVITLPVFEERWSAGAAMVRFLRRFFTSKTPRDARLFAGFSARGARMRLGIDCLHASTRCQKGVKKEVTE